MSVVFRFLWRGKTLGRALFTEEIRKHVQGLSGRIVDLGSGRSPSYRAVLPSGIDYLATDYDLLPEQGLSIDLNKPLPFSDSSERTILCFNTLYIIEDPDSLIREVYRVLEKGGTFLLSSPLLWSEIPEPHDYNRFTAEGLERLLCRAGFSEVVVTRYGERFSVCANLLHPFLLTRLVRVPVYVLALWLDSLIPARFRQEHPAPLGYFVVAKK